MTSNDQNEPDLGSQSGSLKERLAEKRRAIRKSAVIDIPVPGYEDDLVARYVTLDYTVLRKIGQRAEGLSDEIQGEINIAADTLVNACSGLFEIVPDGTEGSADATVLALGADGKPKPKKLSVKPTGHRWSSMAARDLFGVGLDDLPEPSTARDALLSCFPDNTSVVLHFAEYSRQASDVTGRVNKEMVGESKAG